MPFPTTVDAIVDAPPVTAATRIASSHVLGPQRVVVGPTWFNPKSDLYGAVGDGVANDTAAFTAMLSAMPNGSKAFLPPGTYMIDPAALANITKSIHLRGAGKDATFIQARLGAGIYLLQVSGATGVTLEELTLDGTGMTTNAGAALFSVLSSTSIRVRNCRFRNVTATLNALTLNNVQRAWIENNEFTTLQASGVRLEDPGVGNFNDHIWIMNNHFLNCQQGNVGGNAAIQFSGARTAIQHRFCHVEGNNIAGTKRVGIGLDQLDFSWVRGNRIDNAGAIGEPLAFSGSQNRILENFVVQAAGIGASGILFFARSGVGLSNNEIGHNFCTGATSANGIFIDFANTGVSISDLYIHDNECTGNGNGIISQHEAGVASASWSSVVVTNNKLYGNTTAPTSWDALAGVPAYENGNVPGVIQHTLLNPAFVASYTPDCNFSDWIAITLTANITINAPLNPKVGMILTFSFAQDGTGTRTITYNAIFKLTGTVGSGAVTVPAVVTTAFTVTLDRFIYDGFAWRLLSRITGQT